MAPGRRYALVTPARDEAANLRRLAESLEQQTLLPSAWVIVDDGSTDDTLARAEEIARRLPNVRAVAAPPPPALDGPLDEGRRLGRDIVAFNAGVGALEEAPDYLVKLDADVSFAPDYFDRLIAAFEEDETLGIAGGVCYELRDGEWRAYHVTGGHVRGATRMYRWACYSDVAPLDERIGWDGVDEIKARLAGWTTRSVPLPFYHHRNLGARDGARKAWLIQGSLAHYMGHRASYVAMRALFRARREPAALWILWAYLGATVRRAPRHPNVAVRSYVRRQQQLRRLPLRMLEALGRGA
jgi:biofilm PGA synthesis N-glycosyltransferase PgaC